MKSVLVTIDGDDARVPAWRSYKKSQVPNIQLITASSSSPAPVGQNENNACVRHS